MNYVKGSVNKYNLDSVVVQGLGQALREIEDDHLCGRVRVRKV